MLSSQLESSTAYASFQAKAQEVRNDLIKSVKDSDLKEELFLKLQEIC